MIPDELIENITNYTLLLLLILTSMSVTVVNFGTSLCIKTTHTFPPQSDESTNPFRKQEKTTVTTKREGEKRIDISDMKDD